MLITALKILFFKKVIYCPTLPYVTFTMENGMYTNNINITIIFIVHKLQIKVEDKNAHKFYIQRDRYL